jgi:hypothetical protein
MVIDFEGINGRKYDAERLMRNNRATATVTVRE